MQTLHYITMLLAGANLCVLAGSFLRYFAFRKRGIRSLNYGLLLHGTALFGGVLTVVSFLLPPGTALEFCVAMLAFCGLLTNTFFTFTIIYLVGFQAVWLGRLQKLLVLVPTLLFPIYLTNPLHHLFVTEVTKHADGFAYDMGMGMSMLPISTYSVLITLLAVVEIFRGGYKKVGQLQQISSRILMVVITTLPALLSLLEGLFPLLANLRVSLVFNWVPIIVVSYLFFGYLPSARRMALDVIDDAYVAFDLNGHCVDANGVSAGFFALYQLAARPTAEEFATLLGMAHLRDFEQREIALRSAEQTKYYKISSFPLLGGFRRTCGQGFIIAEVTDYINRMSKLSNIAVEDPLTRTKNRRFLEEHAQAILADANNQSHPLTVLMLDIDFFKKVNDTYGHNVGDEILVETSNLLRRNIRERDLVIRYGGEEFLILCQEMANASALQTAERIRHNIERHRFQTTAGELQITISIGVYTKIPLPEDTMEQLIGLADKQLYLAKESGRNLVR